MDQSSRGVNCQDGPHWMTAELLAEGIGGNLLCRSDRQYERTRPSLEYYDKDLARARKVGFRNGFDGFEGPRYGADRNAFGFAPFDPFASRRNNYGNSPGSRPGWPVNGGGFPFQRW